MLKFTVVKIAIVPTVIPLQLIFKTLNTVSLSTLFEDHERRVLRFRFF